MPSQRRVRAPSRLQRVVYTLRTEGGTRGQEAWAIGLGLAVGFSPFIGLHLGMCIAFGWLFGLNRLKLYLAANLVNPLIMPGVLFVEVQLGSWLRRGDTYALSLDAFTSMDPWHFGLDLLLGGMVLSIVGGLVAGGLTYAALGRRHRDPSFTRLTAAAADRYLGTSLTAWEFARAKLRGDPVYRAVLASGWLPASGVLVDVGWPGLLLAPRTGGRGRPRRAVATATDGRCRRPDCASTASSCVPVPPIRPATRWVTPPRSRPAMRARRRCPRLSSWRPSSTCCTWSTAPRSVRWSRASPPPCDRGILLVREADAAAGWRFRLVRFGNRITALCRGRLRPRFAFRTAAEWQAELADLGFDVSVAPMGDGTPFANVLLVARRLAPQSTTAS